MPKNPSWSEAVIWFAKNKRFYGGVLLAPCPTPRWRTTSCRLSATAYSIDSQLPTISGVCLLHPQPEDVPCHGDRRATSHGCFPACFVKTKINTDKRTIMLSVVLYAFEIWYLTLREEHRMRVLESRLLKTFGC
jgi:hypothetical protein